MTAATDESRTWTFLAPSLSRPAGGLIALFELVNAIARRGETKIRVVHVPTSDTRLRGLSEVPWATFEPTVEHLFPATLDPDGLPDSDVVVYTTMLIATLLSPDSGEAGRRFIETLQAEPDAGRLPILFLQGQGVFSPEAEELALRLPGPKVCVGTWLGELSLARGVPARDVVHIPNGVDPSRFHIMRPIADRPPGAAMNFDPHPVKAGEVGLDAIERLQDRLGVPAVAFGTRIPERPLAAGLRFEQSPSQATIAKDIYNEAALFLQPSRQEGFGMCAVEAMACGCALVTTANGGSADYAFDGETAIVCGNDAEEMVDAMARLVRDDALRARIAVNGSKFVERFRWETSAERLANLVHERLAERL